MGYDALHDANGFIYSYYIDSRQNSVAYHKPSDNGAYWRCTARSPSGNTCGFLLLEKNGAFKEISLSHKHDDSKRRKVKCSSCLRH